MGRRFVRWGAVALGAALAVGLGLRFGKLLPRAQAQTQPFVTATVGRGTVDETVSATGTIQENSQIDVPYLVPGRVTSVPVKLGQTVQSGQTLAVLADTSGLAAQVAAGRAALAQAEAQLQKMQNPSLTVDPNTVAGDRVKLQQAQAAVQAAQLNLQQQQQNLQRAEGQAVITAPASGVVQNLSVTQGGSVTSGQSLLDIVPPGSPVVVLAQIPQTGYVGAVGDGAAVIINAVSQTFNGTVTSVNTGNPSSLGATLPDSAPSGRGSSTLPPTSGGGTVQVTVTLPDSASTAALRNGMTALVTIHGTGGQTAQGPGVVQYQNDWNVTAPVGGTVSQLDVSAGATVSAGQTLAQIAGSDVQAAIQQAQQAVQQAQVQLQQAQQGVAAAQVTLQADQHPVASTPRWPRWPPTRPISPPRSGSWPT
jgi:macrolide-specific efflux system membrane fusion protein